MEEMARGFMKEEDEKNGDKILNLYNGNISLKAEIKIVELKSYFQDALVLFQNLTNAMIKDRSGGPENYFWTIYGLIEYSPHISKQECMRDDINYSSCTERLE
ncbi:hypothetical protein LguiB_005844 [Lonicera macranthoides]